ncbi:hypothetical protein [Mesorhizobium sp. P17.1]|nr:hypothetical protein [Mesorhizobium sp. P17.1]MDF3178141.1 hypothetical protein [Mesorhizobium sp. P17.1]
MTQRLCVRQPHVVIPDRYPLAGTVLGKRQRVMGNPLPQERNTVTD